MMEIVSLWDKNGSLASNDYDVSKMDLTQLDVQIYEPLQSLEVEGVDLDDPYKSDSKSPNFACPINPKHATVQATKTEGIADKLKKTTTMLHREIKPKEDNRK